MTDKSEMWKLIYNIHVYDICKNKNANYKSSINLFL